MVRTGGSDRLDRGEVTFRDLIRVIWNGKWIIMVVTALTTASAIVASLIVKEEYEAIVVVAPVSDESTGLGGASSLLSQFGSLASLAGISVSGDSKKQEAIAILRSAALVERYIQENKLLPVLFAEQWDAMGNRWKVDDPKSVPTLWKAREFFRKKVRTITEDAKSGLVTLTVTWTDPKLAAQWANGLVKMTNDYTRSQVISESERNIAFLNNQIAKTDVVEVQKALYALIEAEIKKMMLARGNEQYALKVIDPAVPAERRSSPNRILWTAAGMFAGFFLSVFIVIALAAWRADLGERGSPSVGRAITDPS